MSERHNSFVQASVQQITMVMLGGTSLIKIKIKLKLNNCDAGGNQLDKDEVLRDSIVGHMYYFTKSIIIRRGDYTNNRLSGFPPNLTVQQLQCLSKMCHFSSNYPIGSRTFHHRLVIAIAIDVLAHLVSRCMQCGVDTNTLEKGHRNIFGRSHKYWISAYQ